MIASKALKWLLYLSVFTGVINLVIGQSSTLRSYKVVLLSVAFVLTVVRYISRKRSGTRHAMVNVSMVGILMWLFSLVMAVLVGHFTGIPFDMALNELRIIAFFTLVFIIVHLLDITSVLNLCVAFEKLSRLALVTMFIAALFEMILGPIRFMSAFGLTWGENTSMWVVNFGSIIRPDSTLTDPFSFGDASAILSIVVYSNYISKRSLGKSDLLYFIIGCVDTLVSTSRNAVILLAVGLICIFIVKKHLDARDKLLQYALLLFFSATVIRVC
ncbi:hypothetical protein [Alicyclobacillus macrosporangiidus]|uniref:Uncharacterized protein n=1 Tax=Alicyclobacillus macrosporangiidus TaxID=392015 RepID=A0A1I7G569_9BACL|nr:hypothetical protein [Alicyclobacillus macrosporangiidus]SFU43597.1 hypothetical protein SAMN05421543_1021 [Alicyclobacillus macrosporangiidus]